MFVGRSILWQGFRIYGHKPKHVPETVGDLDGLSAHGAARFAVIVDYISVEIE